MRTHQAERERRHQEEQRLLKQELAKLRVGLQQKDRELQTRLRGKRQAMMEMSTTPTFL